MISFVTAAYKETVEADVFINSLLLQTNPNWECIIYCDEPNEYIKNCIKKCGDSRVRYFQNEKSKGFWGHANRKYALENLVEGDFVLQASIQDYYLPITVECINNLSKDFDFIFFNCIHNGMGYEILNSEPRICGIDWGSFAVRTSLAKKVGIEKVESRVTDGIFVENIFKVENVRYHKINKILTIHN
jgi:hypothetical protein